MRFLTSIILISILNSILSACVTPISDKRPEGIVVERNKQSRPTWAESPMDKLVVNQAESRFHFALAKQRDLPIAVKQSQTNAIKESFTLWRPIFDKNMREISVINRLQSYTKYSKELAQILDAIAGKIHSDLAQVEDIYYERIRIDDPSAVPELKNVSEYYDVHTLIKIAPIDLEKVKISLSTELQATRIAEFKKLGRELSVTAKK